MYRRRFVAPSAAALGATLTLGFLPHHGTPAFAQAAATPSPGPVPEAAARAHDEGKPVGGGRLGTPGVQYQAPAGVPTPPPLDAGGYIVADIDTGKVVLAKDVHAPSLPASTMKAVTALTVVPRLDPTTPFTGAYEDAAVDGTKVGIMPGSTYTVGQCVQALLMSSANDCAVALARVNGGLATTTGQMNALLRSLGALDTTAKNTSGLDATGQMASAYDLALVGRAAVRDPNVAPYLTTKYATFPGKEGPAGSKRPTFGIGSHNRLLFNYAGTIGVKNGYTIKARHTYIGAVRRGDKAYVLAYVNSSTANWRSQAALFDWAFAYGDKVGELGTLVEPATAATGENTGPAGAARNVVAAAVAGQPGRAPTTLRVIGVTLTALALTVVALRARVLLRRRRRRLARARR